MLGATIEMNLKLSMVSVLVGAVLFAPHAFGLAKPVKFVDSARKFPPLIGVGLEFDAIGDCLVPL